MYTFCVGARVPSFSLPVFFVSTVIPYRGQVYPLPAVVAGPSAPYAVITGGSSGIGREIANEVRPLDLPVEVLRSVGVNMWYNITVGAM